MTNHSAPPTVLDRGVKISLILPVRDCEDQVLDRINRAIETIDRCIDAEFEMIVVDDGSEDQTAAVVNDASRRSLGMRSDAADGSDNSDRPAPRASLRLAKHERPRGLEAAGQTGLERSTGQVVLIAEDQRPICDDDFRRLLSMAEDLSVVAARCESRVSSPVAPLVRRLRASSADADQRIDATGHCALQMVRRPMLSEMERNGGRPLQCSQVEIREAVRSD